MAIPPDRNRTRNDQRMTRQHTPIHPVILSGGAGTRLWPLSRAQYPKQLLPIATQRSMLQDTAARIANQPGFAAPIVICGEPHRFVIARQLADSGAHPESILLEPEGRNTAPAIALAACWIADNHGPDSLMLVMPSDHVIADPGAFRHAVADAAPAATAGHLVTFGIHPDRAETGYGYIEQGAPLPGMPAVRAVDRFVEKPDLATAQAYVSGGRHAWNGGIFLFSAGGYLEALKRFAPEVADACAAAMASAQPDGLFLRPDATAFCRSPSISIDYAVMEKTDRAAVVPVDMGWSDVGSWDALWAIKPHDAHGNAIEGAVTAIDCGESLFRVEGGPPIAALGLDGMVIVSTKDAILVAPRARAQDVKAIVDELKRSNNDSHASHCVVHRPWGTYETTDHGDRFQTKRIVVEPGARLSLQMHHHRAEHWIVVSGTAKVTVGDKEILLQENQSTYIPAGTMHRLENPGRIPLHLIEVQCGPYLGEDDIVRFEDSYGRTGTGN